MQFDREPNLDDDAKAIEELDDSQLSQVVGAMTDRGDTNMTDRGDTN